MYEGDQRHVEISMNDTGILDESREISTPTDKSINKLESHDVPLSPEMTTKYRGITARMNYLGQDRSDIQFAVKELGKEMSSPTDKSWVKLKRLVRYLKGAPRARIRYAYQGKPKAITVWADSDFAGCEKSRKSTSAGVVQMGNHLVKSWSTNQAVIALSSGEAEYYALVKAASVALGMESMLKDLGFAFEERIELKSDASAAIGISNRIGVGKVRHIEVNQLWLQEMVAGGKVRIEKVWSEDNLADALTKGVDAQSIAMHLGGVNVEIRNDRHPMAPSIDVEEKS